MAVALSDASLSTALHGALQHVGRKPYEEALSAWEAAPGFCLALMRAYAPSSSIGHPQRLLAVLCLKNAVQRRWHQRGGPNEPPIAEAEKAALKEALLAALDEPDPQLWAQLELIIAIIGRLDGLSSWPVLMPTLLDVASRADPRAAARGLSALYRVVKQQASRRLLPHRKQFFALTAELEPRLRPMHATHVRALLAGIAQQPSADAAAAWLGVGVGSAGGAAAASSAGGAGSAAGVAAAAVGGGGGGEPSAVGGGEGGWVLRAAVALCKLERQLLLQG